MIINSFAIDVYRVLQAMPTADADYILAQGIGHSAAQVEFVIMQLKIFGYI